MHKGVVSVVSHQLYGQKSSFQSGYSFSIKVILIQAKNKSVTFPSSFLSWKVWKTTVCTRNDRCLLLWISSVLAQRNKHAHESEIEFHLLLELFGKRRKYETIILRKLYNLMSYSCQTPSHFHSRKEIILTWKKSKFAISIYRV